MAFINRTYFVQELNIPNTNSEMVGPLLDGYILKYEADFLQRLLGQTMYSELIAADLTNVINQKYIDLVQGKSYTYALRNYNYFGIAPGYTSTGLYKESPIANYIYYWFMRGLATQTAAMGEVKGVTENSISANPGEKMARAWNEISKWEHGFMNFIYAYPLVYTLPYYGRTFAPINEFNI